LQPYKDDITSECAYSPIIGLLRPGRINH